MYIKLFPLTYGKPPADDVFRLTEDRKRVELKLADCQLTQSMLEEQVLMLQRQNNDLRWQVCLSERCSCVFAAVSTRASPSLAQLEEKEQVIDNMADSKKLLEEKSDMLALVDAYLVRARLCCLHVRRRTCNCTCVQADRVRLERENEELQRQLADVSAAQAAPSLPLPAASFATPTRPLKPSPTAPPSSAVSNAALDAFSSVALPEIRAMKNALNAERRVRVLCCSAYCVFADVFVVLLCDDVVRALFSFGKTPFVPLQMMLPAFKLLYK